MTPRQRIVAALGRQQADRVPIDLGGTESSGLTGVAWHKLARLLGGQPSPPKMLDPYQQVAAVPDAWRDRLGIDTTPLFIEPADWAPGTLGDGSPCLLPARWRPVVAADGSRELRDADGTVLARMPAGGYYFDPVAAPLAGCGNARELEARRETIATVDLPGFCDEPLADTVARADALHATERAVVFNFCCHLLHGATGLRGYSQFMMDLALDRPLADALLELLLEAFLERTRIYGPALRGRVDVVLLNDDLGTQNGPMISPAVYGELIQPRQKRLFAAAAQAFDAPILFHSCGSIRAFLPGLIDAGVAAVNPVQVSAAAMDSAELKREFGRDLCFWGGGCDSQRVLCGGTPDDVRAEVRRRVRDFHLGRPPGGFVFTQVHNVQPDVPPENVLAMLQAVRQGE